MTVKLLLVEDYHDFAEIASEQLEKAGYPVTYLATNGNAALNALDDEKYGGFDAVITDFELGTGPDGGDVAKRALDEGTPLVILWSAVNRRLEELPEGTFGRDGFHLLRKDDIAEVLAALDELEGHGR